MEFGKNTTKMALLCVEETIAMESSMGSGNGTTGMVVFGQWKNIAKGLIMGSEEFILLKNPEDSIKKYISLI
jgi:hypothetical protein